MAGVPPGGSVPPVEDVPVEDVSDEDIMEALKDLFIDEGFAALGTPSGTGLFDPLGGMTATPEQQAMLRAFNLRDLVNFSPTQLGVFEALLSAVQIAPEDFFEFHRRSFQGFNPVGAGASATFSGVL